VTALFQQVSGHSDAFMKVSETELWKLTDPPEQDMFKKLMESPLKDLVPEYIRDVPLIHWGGREPGENSVCIELSDLTAGFGEWPCVMDIKVGNRTFLEDEVSNLKLRPDMLKKMDKLDPTAATPEEREAGGITKMRYMQFRERMSTSSTLGFRVEGLHVKLEGGANAPGGVQTKENLSLERDEKGLVPHFRTFVQSDPNLKAQYLQRLQGFRETLANCSFFQNHQFINTSLLFVHDAEKQDCGLWMIDFSKARPSSRQLTHTEPWELGNEEDGYLFGLDNLIRIWRDL